MEVLKLKMVDILGDLDGQADAGSEFMKLDSADVTEDIVHAILEDDVAMESAQEAEMPSGMIEAEEMEVEVELSPEDMERAWRQKREEEEEKRRDEADKAERERRQAEENEQEQIAINQQIAEQEPAPKITDEWLRRNEEEYQRDLAAGGYYGGEGGGYGREGGDYSGEKRYEERGRGYKEEEDYEVRGRWRYNEEEDRGQRYNSGKWGSYGRDDGEEGRRRD
ncbi:hypothetical protein RUND412_002823 [Rhizina undulata]